MVSLLQGMVFGGVPLKVGGAAAALLPETCHPGVVAGGAAVAAEVAFRRKDRHFPAVSAGFIPFFALTDDSSLRHR